MDIKFCTQRKRVWVTRTGWKGYLSKNRVQYCICPAEDMLSSDWEEGVTCYLPARPPYCHPVWRGWTLPSPLTVSNSVTEMQFIIYSWFRPKQYIQENTNEWPSKWTFKSLDVYSLVQNVQREEKRLLTNFLWGVCSVKVQNIERTESKR